MNDLITELEFSDFLKAFAEHLGGVPELARRYGLDRSNVYKMLSGKLQPQPALLAQLGIEEARVYFLPSNLAEWYERHGSAQSVKTE